METIINSLIKPFDYCRFAEDTGTVRFMSEEESTTTQRASMINAQSVWLEQLYYLKPRDIYQGMKLIQLSINHDRIAQFFQLLNCPG